MNFAKTQRREGRRRAAAAVVPIMGGVLGVTTVMRGSQFHAQGRAGGIAVMAVGAGLIIGSFLIGWWANRTTPAAIAADAREAMMANLPVLPFGAVARGSGVVLRSRAAIRVVPGFIPPMLAFAALGQYLDTGNLLVTWIMLGIAVGIIGLWIAGRWYEFCMDSQGVWRRKAPRRRIAWQDVTAVERMEVLSSSRVPQPPDLILHGATLSPSGKRRPALRIRCGSLAIAPMDLERLAAHFAARPALDTNAAFHTWS